VLDKLGIDVMLANRVAMGRGLDNARFRWVAYDDALLFPLDNAGLKRANPNRAFFFEREDALLKRYLRESNVARLPATLAEYVSQIVAPTLERQRRGGAVAIKFEAAYLRSLDFGEASLVDAMGVYARGVLGGEPQAAGYKTLQDYLFRAVAREAGRLGLAVHIHTGAGCGNYFYVKGSEPALLESVFNDPSLRKTNFVMLHGAPGFDWEEVGWQTTTTARSALALALTGMMRDGEITRERASEIARGVMRENAARLYGIGAR
jgi:hypothetical protein